MRETDNKYVFEIKDFSFSYPGSDINVLENINLNIRSGEYVVLCGKSGCGKSTLLRNLKSAIAPRGKKTGEILYNGQKLSDVPENEQCGDIGFVMQDADSQIVADKVCHEIAFGLENTGLDRETIRMRVSETSSWMGLQSRLSKNVNELSGGQKQLLNLASVMVMNPKVLILDEPVSQLDPLSAVSFLSNIKRINEELGVTVIITEHRLEEILPVADRVILLENGKISADCKPNELANHLSGKKDFLYYSLPAASRIFSGYRNIKIPLTVKEGRAVLTDESVKGFDFTEIKHDETPVPDTKIVAKDLFFRYSKNSEDVLKGLNIEIPGSSFTGILGGNSAGKTTLLKILSGIYKPYRGRVKYNDNCKGENLVGYVPQDVKLMFTSKSLKEEFQSASDRYEDIEYYANKFGLSSLLDRHPYDLSGGEMQKAAIVKSLLINPAVLLLDEPTKGLDPEFKNELGNLLKEIAEKGTAVVTVSHDIEFCAKNCDYCVMLFDGQAVKQMNGREFFSDNIFYTTSANRISRGIFKNAITDDDVITLLRMNSTQNDKNR